MLAPRHGIGEGWLKDALLVNGEGLRQTTVRWSIVCLVLLLVTHPLAVHARHLLQPHTEARAVSAQVTHHPAPVDPQALGIRDTAGATDCPLPTAAPRPLELLAMAAPETGSIADPVQLDAVRVEGCRAAALPRPPGPTRQALLQRFRL
ncbi:MAG: hypothetical protein DCC58_17495 [Chloroflexi bacterium]|nr:MAG: hypothetical protein DCC58_17495 [Chloroflexota bacterium]